MSLDAIILRGERDIRWRSHAADDFISSVQQALDAIMRVLERLRALRAELQVEVLDRFAERPLFRRNEQKTYTVTVLFVPTFGRNTHICFVSDSKLALTQITNASGPYIGRASRSCTSRWSRSAPKRLPEGSGRCVGSCRRLSRPAAPTGLKRAGAGTLTTSTVSDWALQGVPPCRLPCVPESCPLPGDRGSSSRSPCRNAPRVIPGNHRNCPLMSQFEMCGRQGSCVRGYSSTSQSPSHIFWTKFGVR